MMVITKKHRLTLKKRVNVKKKKSLFIMILSMVKFETGIHFFLPSHGGTAESS